MCADAAARGWFVLPAFRIRGRCRRGALLQAQDTYRALTRKFL
jgi:hypothetical protein